MQSPFGFRKRYFYRLHQEGEVKSYRISKLLSFRGNMTRIIRTSAADERNNVYVIAYVAME